MKRSILLAAVSVLMLFAPTAQAADIALKAPAAPPVPAWSWTGFYVGVNLGGHWGNDSLNYNADLGWLTCTGCSAASPAARQPCKRVWFLQLILL